MTVIRATAGGYNPVTRDVWVLTDAGVRLDVPGGVVDSAIRLLRLGQRVRLEQEGERTVRLSLW